MVTMSYLRKVVRKNKNGTVVTYYEEVESHRINGKVVQTHIRSLGKDKESPDSFPVERVHFGHIATRLMQGDLSPNELLDMIEKMGHHVSRENLERIGLNYNFKKNTFSLSLYRRRSSGKQKDASGAGKD
jgi:hypothetical protein